jgi:flagellar biosynthesis/type III secretory pathway chaperone
MQCDKAVELNKSFEAMIALLEAEHKIIRTRDMDALVAITQEKETMAKQLELLGQILIRELKLSGDANSSAKLLDLVGAHCKTDSMLATSLKANSAKVQELNNRNGILLQSIMRVNEQSLNILTGRSAGVMTYQASGLLKPEHTFSPTPLASA